MHKVVLIFISFFALFLNSTCLAQDLTSDVAQDFFLADSSDIFTERIKIISRSGKTFILTNSNQLLNKGDFITLLFKTEGPIARAVVAKTIDDKAGIKILKVYSLKRWQKLGKEVDVDILKGDDSKLFVKAEPKPEEIIEESIIDEEDLFNDKGIDEDLESFDTSARNIKPDNLISAGGGFYRYTNTIQNETLSDPQFHFAWAYQFADNYWAEGLFSYVQTSNLTEDTLFAVINTYTLRLKYVFKAPLYSYFVPYIGYQIQTANSPEAGNVNDENEAAKELLFIDEQSRNQFVAGITLLRRLVPGWFIKANLGNDIYNIGVAIEF